MDTGSLKLVICAECLKHREQRLVWLVDADAHRLHCSIHGPSEAIDINKELLK